MLRITEIVKPPLRPFKNTILTHSFNVPGEYYPTIGLETTNQQRNVFSIMSGVVEEIGVTSLVIKHLLDGFLPLYSHYGSLEKIYVKEGSEVDANSIIGIREKNKHLIFSVSTVNPKYFGANIDPVEFFRRSL